jgi:hypothetical protein
MAVKISYGKHSDVSFSNTSVLRIEIYNAVVLVVRNKTVSFIRLSLFFLIWIFAVERNVFFRRVYQGIMPERRISIMTGLRETKFLRLFGLISVHTPNVTVCILC